MNEDVLCQENSLFAISGLPDELIVQQNERDLAMDLKLWQKVCQLVLYTVVWVNSYVLVSYF